MKLVRAVPLTPEAYAAFGQVLCARDTPARSANQGTAQVWDRLVDFHNSRSTARLNASVFRCQPCRTPLQIALLERHPGSTQLFVPMTARRFLVVVAPGGERPEIEGLQVFLGRPGQGVSYRPGVWHHPMLALDEPADFGCFVFEDGSDGDCELVRLDPGLRVLVDT